jgi:5-methylcytosine-specific restriction endonuclease McrA
MKSVLALDEAGTPIRWIDVETAVNYYCRDLVAWSAGEHEFLLRGGTSAVSGVQSSIAANSIIAIRGHPVRYRAYDDFQMPVTNERLFKRDRHVCAYCGGRFTDLQLTREHILPRSRDGRDTWMNLVAACKDCNNRKDDRTPEEARMPLLYLPYVPNRAELMILAGRRILGDQMAFLLQQVPKHSRLLD